MGFSLYTITIANHSQLKSLQDFIFTNLVRMRLIAPHKHPHKNYTQPNIDDLNTAAPSSSEFHPSPSLVPLPIHLISRSHKDNLPIVQYMVLKPCLRARDEEEEEADSCCAVCLSGIEPWHNVRKLSNCNHAFHVECLDSWMDLGRETCPVCRAELLPGHGEGLRPGQDPWRSERMVYLFGEDCTMGELE